MIYYGLTTDTKWWHTFTWPLSRWAIMTHTQIDYCSNKIMRHTNGSIKQCYVLTTGCISPISTQCFNKVDSTVYCFVLTL